MRGRPFRVLLDQAPRGRTTIVPGPAADGLDLSHIAPNARAYVSRHHRLQGCSRADRLPGRKHTVMAGMGHSDSFGPAVRVRLRKPANFRLRLPSWGDDFQESATDSPWL